MHWIALQAASPEDQAAWGWRCLQFTPRVAPVDEALLAEVSLSLRLWGGAGALVQRLFGAEHEPGCGAGHAVEQGAEQDAGHGLAPVRWAQGPTARVALALLRLAGTASEAPGRIPDDLPLWTLSAAREAAPTLDRMGCRTWGQLRSLPRGGVVRRFGAGLLEALDAAWGRRPEQYVWLQPPESFDVRLELPALATSAPELLWSAQRLLAQLQAWLQARHRGVLALELEWTLDLRRLDGVPLPPHEQLQIRTAQPVQDMAHLRRLAAEHLARAALRAPANHLRLRTLETVPWQAASHSLLPEDNPQGERLHQLVERLSVRLGESQVLAPVARADHRPEQMQSWQPARQSARMKAGLRVEETVPGRGGGAAQGLSAGPVPLPPSALSPPAPAGGESPAAAVYPAWLLSQPLPLSVRGEKPYFHGPLRLLAGPQRLETGWWDAPPQGPALRDYFIARSEQAGLVWVFRERLSPQENPEAGVRWFLHGLYA